MRIKQAFKNFNSSLLTDDLTMIGYLANLGIAGIAQLIFAEINNAVVLSDLWKWNTFSIAYVILYFFGNKIIREDYLKIKLGYILAGMFLIVCIMIRYIILFFSL
jgi:hypothetical protein